MCNKEGPDYVSFLNKIMTECPNHSEKIEKAYYEVKLSITLKCSDDSATGENWRGLVVASDWERYKCESSCIPNAVSVYKEVCGNYQGSAICNSLRKHLYTCDESFVDLGKDGKGTTSDTSDALTISSQVALLSLIMCLIFAFFK